MTDRPSMIVLPSHIGYGSPNKQDTASAHGSPLGEDEIKLTKEALGWPYEEPFTVPDEVYEHFEAVKERGIAAERSGTSRFEAYAAEHRRARRRAHAPDQPPQCRSCRRSRRRRSFEPGDDPIATRAASGKALNWLAPQVPELIGGSADLAPSTLDQPRRVRERPPPRLRRPQPPLRDPRARDGRDRQRA